MFTGMPTHLGQEFPRTAAEVTALLGLTPSNLWLFQETGAPVVDVIAAQNMSDYGTALYRQPTAFPRVGIGCASDVSEGLIINPNPFDDDGVTSFAYLGLIRVGTIHLTAQRAWCYHYSDAAAPSVQCYTSVQASDSSGNAAAIAVNVNGTFSCAIAVNHGLAYHPWLWVMDRAAATMRVRTDLGNAQVSIAGAGAFGGVGSRYFFIDGGTIGADVDVLWLARMSGANAEGLNDAQIIHDFWVGP